MHLFNKTLGFMAVLCVMPAAFAATARTTTTSGTTGRVSIAGSTARMPNLVLNVSNGKSAVSTTTTTSSSLLADKDCIDSYTECVKGSDACGENFEECTNKVLFHAQMPDCLSTLAQCSSSGVNSLFGTTNISALSNVASTNSYGEVTDYTYPTDGSVLGQMITAAAISNRYDTSTCVRRYTSCLKKESVCGADFELCTTDKEFRKQRVFCDSTLARCQGDGVKELLGSTTPTANPTKTSRVGEMISEGAALAAVNAVSTCYKTVDNCILSACANNPYKCYENSNQSVVDLVDAINNGTTITTELVESIVNKSTIAAYIKGQCMDTIGSSKYCYATFIGNGQMPTNAQLRDEDNQEEIYDEAYASRMNAAMKTKIAELVEKFDTKAKAKCTETIKSCAMRTCGGGMGAACYSTVFGNADKSINGSATYNEIKTGCASIVNTDANCKYAAANPNSTGTYSYTYINRDAFDVLFPEYDNGAENDVIGVVATLNAALSTNYNDAAIANMKKQCQSVASSCVKSLCGNDFVNCYRNRTDVYSNLTQTGETAFDKSMNKVGGVLDYTIVLGLCMDTVKNASVCEEHLAIEAAKIKMAGGTPSSSSVRSDWIDAGATNSLKRETENVQAVDENGNNLCTSKKGDQGPCNTVDASGNVYDTPVMISYTTYVQSQAAEGIFKDVLYDIEKEAQAKYNAKLTKEQNMCMSSNNGGIIGNRDLGNTFMWVKLKSNKVPNSYSVDGLTTNQFVASNDLYGSFCRVRVTLQSDDKKIQEYMKNKSWTTAYFATGDSFTCGSWIPEKDLEAIAQDVADKKVGTMNDASHKSTRFWTTLLGTVGGGVGGGYAGNAIVNKIQGSNGLGGLLKGNTKSAASISARASEADLANAEKCVDYLSRSSQSDINTGISYARKVSSLRSDADALSSKVTTVAATPGALVVKDAVSIQNPNYTAAVSGANTVVKNAVTVKNPAFEKLESTARGHVGELCEKYRAANMTDNVVAVCDGNKDLKNINVFLKEKLDGGTIVTTNQDGDADANRLNSNTVNDVAFESIVKKTIEAIDAMGNVSAEITIPADTVVTNGSVTIGGQTIVLPTGTETMVATGNIPQYITVPAGTPVMNGRVTVNGQSFALPANVQTIRSNDTTADVQSLRDRCQDIVSQASDKEQKQAKQRMLGTAIGAGVGATAGGLLVYKATYDIQKANLDAEQKAAIEEWMNDVGRHITCYIGSDEAGNYGDMISTSLE